MITKCISKQQMKYKDLDHKLYFANKLYTIEAILFSIPRRLRYKYPESEYIRVQLKRIK